MSRNRANSIFIILPNTFWSIIAGIKSTSFNPSAFVNGAYDITPTSLLINWRYQGLSCSCSLTSDIDVATQLLAFFGQQPK